MKSAAAKWTLTLLIALLVAIVAAGVAVMAYEHDYRARIYAGVSVMGIPVGGLAPAEALSCVQESLEDGVLPYIALSDGASRWVVGARDLGARLDAEDAIRAAWAFGRSGVFRHDMAARARALWWGYDIVPPVTLDAGALSLYMRGVARQVGHPTRPAQLRVTGLQAMIGEGQAGREVDLAATYAAVDAALRAALGESRWGDVPRLAVSRGSGASALGPSATEPIPVPLSFRDTLPLSADMSEAEARIDALLGAPLILTLAPPGEDVARRWAVDQATLAEWLTVDPAPREGDAALSVGIDRAQVQAFVEGIAETVARPPREPRFGYDPDSRLLTVLSPEQSGYSLDVPAAVDAVLAACEVGSREVPLPVIVTAPRVTEAALRALMPLDLISEGVSSFVGSSPERLQNIHVASARFQGVTIPPNATFSFLQHLGPVTAANGYSESWVIYDNRTILGPGGGVCQVSTTCFRAAFWGGYPIVQRSPHYYRVSWYEPPIGLDAAVYSPEVDMVFRNDTDTPILIVTEVNETEARLSFRFYGQKPDRTVTMEGPVTSNPRPAGAPIYEQDPALSAGARVQMESAHDGIDATVVRVISVPGAEPIREEFVSRYYPWPARYRVGPDAAPAGGAAE